ncbi:MAG: YmdB family metallophosphoesterase [Clostridia bacterium]|nr:YmdB family metallophosphoesterase [Clostridia bacterium]
MIVIMKILAVGDVVGRRSIEYLSKTLRRTAASLGADLVVVNGENASEIHGLCKADAQALLDAGADLITLGNHAFGSRDLYGFLDDNTDVVIRPANYPAACPGVGCTLRRVNGLRVLCMNLSGTAFMEQLDNPFVAADRLLEREKGEYDIALLDFHGEATSEKLAMGFHLDGRVQIVFGTHTHVPTADTRILPAGTGYVTDLGMTGPTNGILGTDAEAVLYKMRTRMPVRFTVADGPIEAQAVLFTLEDTKPHRCVKVERVTF